MKSKLILFLVIRISCAVDEGEDKLSDSKKMSCSYALKKALDQNVDPVWTKKKESDGYDISTESIFEDAMSGSVKHNESVPDESAPGENTPVESAPDELDGLRELFLEKDNSFGVKGSEETVPDESAPDELDGSHNVISQDNNSSGGSQLPDSQEVLGLKNLTLRNEQFKVAEDINSVKQDAIDSSEDDESKELSTNRDKEDGDIKFETFPIDSNTKIDNVDDNSTESDTTVQGESSYDSREFEEQDLKVESLNDSKDVSSESSKTPLISAEKNKVNSENKGISKDSSTNSSNKEDNTSIKDEASGPSGESFLDFKNEASSAIVGYKKNFINDMDKATVIQFTSDDKITPTPLSENERTSKNNDTGNLIKTPLNFVTETIPLSNEHKEANDVEKDANDASHAPSKIEIGKATPPIIKDAEANIKDKGLKTVISNSLNVNSAEDKKHFINVNDAGHSPSEIKTEKSTALGSSTKATETNINVNDAGHASPEVEKSTALSNSTTAIGDVNNHKEASIEDNSPSEIENSLDFNSAEDVKHFINDKETSTADHASLGAGTESVTSPISITFTKDTNNEDDFKERNSSDKVNDDPLGILERNIANSVKDLNNFSESQSNSLTEDSTSKSVNKNDKNIIQSINNLNKNINTDFIEAEGINVTGSTPSYEASGNDKIIEDKLNSIKNVTTEFIKEEGSNHNKAISPKSDDKVGNINSSDSSINLKGTENLINKNKDNNTPFPNIHNPDFKIKENSTGRNEGDDKNPFDTRNENFNVGSVDIMNLSKDKPSTSTSNTIINSDQNIYNNVGTALVEGDGHEDKNNSNSDYDLEDNSYLEGSIPTNIGEDSITTNIGEDSISTNIGEGSTLGTIGEDSTLGLIGESSILGTIGESSSLSNNEDSYDLNINNQNGALFGNGLNTVNNRPQTNRTPPILLKFTVSRI